MNNLGRKRTRIDITGSDVYDTEDPSPRQEGKFKIHKSTTFKNIGMGLGGLGIGYAGLKHGNAADAISKAADEYRKSAPSHMARAAHAKVIGVLQRLRKNVHLQSRLKEIRFAKPGEMTKKWVPTSKWITDPQSNALFKGATAIGSTQKDVATLSPGLKPEITTENIDDLTGMPSRSRRLVPSPPKGRIVKRKGVRQNLPAGTSLGKRFSPQREAMMNADIAADIHGEHKEYHAKRAKIVEAHKYQLENTYKGHPEELIKTVKQQQKDQLSALDEAYRSELRSRPAYGMRLDALRRGVRRSAAQELQNRRQVLQGVRQHVSHTLPAPLPESELNLKPTGKRSLKGTEILGTGRIQTQGREINQGLKVGRYKRKVFTGIAGSHGKKTGFILGGKEQGANFPAELEEYQGKLGVATDIAKTKLNLQSERMHDQLTKRMRIGIQKSHTSLGYAPMHPKTLTGKANEAVHHAVVNPVPPTDIQKAQFTEWLGLKNPNHFDTIRNQYQKMQSADFAGEQAIKSRLIKQGDIFRMKSPIQTFPKLRGIGKGIAIGAGVLGAGYLLKKALGKRKQTQPTQFAVPRALKHEAILGGALAGGITAADAATSTVWPDPDKTRAQSAWMGTKRGALYGTALAGTEPLIRRALAKGWRPKPRVVMSNKLKEVRFQKPNDDDNFKRDVAVGGIEGGLGFLATDRLLHKYTPNIKGLGKFGLAAGVGGLATGTIGYGLNRFLRDFKQKQRDKQFVSKMKEIQFAKWSPPSTEGATSPYGPKKRLTVAQDRYRKMVRENEINRKESNLAKSAVTGAALAGVLGHKKFGLKTSIIGGAAAGLGAETALLLRGRQHRDAYGEENISSKRIERIPYQAAGLGLAGIAGKHLYKRYKFCAKIPEIKFAMTEEEREHRRMLRRWEPEHLHRRGEEIYRGIGRVGRLGRDIYGKVSGKPVLDVRGRQRTPEWKKQWAIRGLAVAGIVGAIKYRGLAKRALHTPLGQSVASKVKSTVEKSPWMTQTVKSARQYGHGVRKEWRDLQREIKQVPKSPTEAVKEYKESEAEKLAKAERRRQAIKKAVESGNPLEGNFKSKLKEVRFAEVLPYWDVRDQRGRSARVYAPGHQKRTRRPKEWYEKKKNRDIIGGALGIGGLASGAGALKYIYKRREAAEEAAKVGEKIITPRTFSPAENLWHRWNPPPIVGGVFRHIRK